MSLEQQNGQNQETMSDLRVQMTMWIQYCILLMNKSIELLYDIRDVPQKQKRSVLCAKINIGQKIQ